MRGIQQDQNMNNAINDSLFAYRSVSKRSHPSSRSPMASPEELNKHR